MRADPLVARLGKQCFSWGRRSLVDANDARKNYIAAQQVADERDMALPLVLARS